MSSSKHLDKICCIVLCFTLILTLLFMNAESLGVSAASKTIGYENRLFDTSRVHTIDIVIDDWEGFIETCTNEEYTMCSVVIDGEAYKNVGIRAKGNTSLSSVASYGNDRYSFKIEFDQYDDTKSYYGLDKLSLNNIIQDNTYMKDYLVYQMMGEFGVAAPLCSYAYITVNGEDFGLYLAVEAVEDAFLTRNYGSDYGDLYKPDSMSMGGGRGNGKDFDMENMEELSQQFGGTNPFEGNSDSSTAFPDMGDFQMPENGETPTFESSENGGNRGGFNGGNQNNIGSFGGGNFDGNNRNDMGGGMGSMGSDDVSLIYSDDTYDSYTNIFDNAKTTVTDADKDRLIASLRSLNENTDIESVVNIDEVIRYFVVHNFAVNFDSYTGSIIHNYYLYEEDGKLEMIPWDYNLAFGGFMSQSDATSLVNYPIDSPVSGGSIESRPMLAWIFANEEYTELYHESFAEFLALFFENGSLEEMIDSVSEMIAPYIEKQPTEFCTYEEFEAGVIALKEFCLLRAESIDSQLDGTIPSTSEGQTQDSSSLINASHINVSDMGSMNVGGGESGGGNRGGFKNTEDQGRRSELPDTHSTTGMNSSEESETGNMPAMPSGDVPNGDLPSGDMPAMASPGGENQTEPMQPPSDFSASNTQSSNLLLLGISVLILGAGLAFAILYGRKRR